MIAPNPPIQPKFSLGQIVATPGALAALEQSGQSPAEFLRLHVLGDWGQVDPEDSCANDRAVVEEERILSAYKTTAGEKLWIITEADRSVTTLLLPEEY